MKPLFRLVRFLACCACAPLVASCGNDSGQTASDSGRGRNVVYTEERAPCSNWSPWRNLYFGDLHSHSALSFDAWLWDTRPTLKTAQRRIRKRAKSAGRVSKPFARSGPTRNSIQRSLHSTTPGFWRIRAAGGAPTNATAWIPETGLPHAATGVSPRSCRSGPGPARSGTGPTRHEASRPSVKRPTAPPRE